MFHLLGITGKARTGKDTAAKYLVEHHGFIKNALADPLKLAAQKIFMLTDEQTWNDEYKEVVIPYWGMSPRQMFQKLGTEGGRNVFGHDVWLKRWTYHYNTYKDHTNYVTSDVRFPNEAQHLRNLGGVIIHLVRPEAKNILTAEAQQHGSEVSLAVAGKDFEIENSGTHKELYAALDNVVASLEDWKVIHG